MYMQRRYAKNGEWAEINEQFPDLDNGIPAFDVNLAASGRTLFPLSLALWARKRIHVWRIAGAGTYKRSLMQKFGAYLTEQRQDFELAMRGETGWGESMDVRASANGVVQFHVYPGSDPRTPSRDIEIRFDRDHAKDVGSQILAFIEDRIMPPERPVLTPEDRIEMLRKELKEKNALIKRLRNELYGRSDP